MFRTVASITAPVSLGLGLAGIAFPQPLAASFGLTLGDPLSRSLARLACASFVGYGVLNWLARDLTDAPAQRAIAIGNATGWLGGGGVTLAALITSSMGSAATWSIVALQSVVTGAWLAVLLQARRPMPSTAPG